MGLIYRFCRWTSNSFGDTVCDPDFCGFGGTSSCCVSMDLLGRNFWFVVDDNKPEEYQYKKQVWNKEGKREEKTAWGRRYDATKCIYETVNDWLYSFKDSSDYSYETIEYYGSYLGILKQSHSSKSL